MPKARTVLADAFSLSPARSEPSKDLALRIRALRSARNWTLETASEHIGLSRSALSKIERHEMSPTFNALHKLASGFGISMIQLMEGEAAIKINDCLVTRRGEGAVHATSQYRLRFLNAALHGNSTLVVVEFTIEAESFSAFEQWDRHDDENLVYVVEGCVDFHREGHADPVTLEAGDSVCFDARVGHAFTRRGTAPVRALSVAIAI